MKEPSPEVQREIDRVFGRLDPHAPVKLPADRSKIIERAAEAGDGECSNGGPHEREG